MMKNLKFNDPLSDYDWNTLYFDYDKQAKESHGKFITCLKYVNITPQPADDRKLYSQIVKKVDTNKGQLDFEIYAAIHYWKMYSTSIRTNKKLKNEPIMQKDAMAAIDKFNLINEKKRLCDRDINRIASLIMWLRNNDKLYGVGNSIGSAICHFMYPDLVPIANRMVFQAIGNSPEESKAAVNDIESIKMYIEHNWMLADRYTASFSDKFSESSIRLIDMSLWATR